MKFTTFVKGIHESDADGNPVRKAGDYVLKEGWEGGARDKAGRPYDSDIHEEDRGKPMLLSDGTLKMKAPKAKGPAGAIARLRIPDGLPTGYQYRWVNVDDRGRPDILASEHDWSMAQINGAIVRKAVGAARDGLTEAVLMRKPQEWYDADQKAKETRNVTFEREKAKVTDSNAEYIPRGKTEVLTDMRVR